MDIKREHLINCLVDFAQAIERIVAGLEKKNRLLNPHKREVVAHYEMGHALVAMGVDPVNKVSIIPRAGSRRLATRSSARWRTAS